MPMSAIRTMVAVRSGVSTLLPLTTVPAPLATSSRMTREAARISTNVRTRLPVRDPVSIHLDHTSKAKRERERGWEGGREREREREGGREGGREREMKEFSNR